MEKKKPFRIIICVLLIFINPVVVFSTEIDDEFIYNGFTRGKNNMNNNNISLDGIAEIQKDNGILRLTNQTSRLYGHAFYPSPLSFINKNGKVVSFSTCIAFAIVPEFKHLGGHGLAFVMSPTRDLTGAQPSQYLGLLNASNDNSVSNHLLAIEFDTVEDFEFHDIDDNHIGIDINSLTSNASVSAAYWSDDGHGGVTTTNFTLKNGNTIKAWIEYDSWSNVLSVTVSPFNKKPPKAVLSYKVDLSWVFKDSMYVGFSASTGLLASSHYVFGWSFKVNGVAEDLNLSKLPSLPRPGKDRTALKSRRRKAMVWKILVPVFTLVATIMGVLGYMFNRNKANKRGRLKELHGVLTDLLKSKATYNDTSNTNMFGDGKTKGETHELHIFNRTCLALATNNFCMKNKLGEGGFGPVYKGKLRNEQEIAVKKLSKSSGQGIEEFKNEVVLISKLQHRNLVRLLGCCVEGEEYMLIYEYMPKRSLDALLFDPRKKEQLDWDKRFNIIGGIARGLLYLHRDSRLRVIHRDLKVSNILLDENMTPKISDFGMARIFGGDQIIDNTKRVVGTFGYMSPEYVMGGTFSEKSDVFSFGVLILEIVSSKKNTSFYNPEQPYLNLILHTWRLWNEGNWSEVVDEGLGDLYSPSEVMKCVHIGLLCVQSRALDRPTMAEVDNMLSNETDRPAPKEPPYTFPASSDNPGFLPIHSSSNNVTCTAVEGR